MWVAVVDFMKAFDSIEHDAIWKALSRQGVHDGYIQILKNLYRRQHGQVKTDKQSRLFQMSRGTKQGDPLSSLLFNAVLEDIFREVKKKWSAKKFGVEISIGRTEFLQNLRFADDVLLSAYSSGHLTEMLKDLSEAASKRVLRIHSEKPKVPTNASKIKHTPVAKELPFHPKPIEVLPISDDVKYLGCRSLYINELM